MYMADDGTPVSARAVVVQLINMMSQLGKRFCRKQPLFPNSFVIKALICFFILNLPD